MNLSILKLNLISLVFYFSLIFVHVTLMLLLYCFDAGFVLADQTCNQGLKVVSCVTARIMFVFPLVAQNLNV